MIPLGIILIAAGIVCIGVGVPRSIRPIVADRSPAQIAAPVKKSEPFGLHMTDTKRAVLWAIPFKAWGRDDAQRGRVTEADLVKEEAEIAGLREWASKLEGGEVKEAYLGWADAFERWIGEARNEMTTHELQRAEDAEKARREAILAALPKPQ